MPEKNIQVALVPHDIAENDVDRNMQMLAQRFSDLRAGTDLIVLPELCFTGFCADRSIVERIAEPNDGKCMEFVRQWSKRLDAAVCGGFLARDSDGKLYNRGFVTTPDGSTSFYDKRHLFAGAESVLFTKGMALPPVVEFRTWKLKMAICYDIRFPVWNRCVNFDYDALIVVANWPHSRSYSWRQLLIARAIENQTYIAACDREGEDIYGAYERYESMTLDHWGNDISEGIDDGTIYSTFDASKLTRDRERFTPWRDADRFQILID